MKLAIARCIAGILAHVRCGSLNLLALQGGVLIALSQCYFRGSQKTANSLCHTEKYRKRERGQMQEEARRCVISAMGRLLPHPLLPLLFACPPPFMLSPSIIIKHPRPRLQATCLKAKLRKRAALNLCLKRTNMTTSSVVSECS